MKETFRSDTFRSWNFRSGHWTGVGQDVVLVLGPYCVEMAGVYVAGAVQAQAYVPGAVKAEAVCG